VQADYAVGRDQDSFDKQYVRNFLKSINFDKKTPLELPPEVCRKYSHGHPISAPHRMESLS